uniref:BZIP domain-containing protein n=1 Tax=Panagrolaimus sp. PS1159 TaxID=55785 RepID=A0AC35GUC0_9BILA
MSGTNPRLSRKLLPVKPEYTSNFNAGLEEMDLGTSVSSTNQPQPGKSKHVDGNGFMNIAEEIIKQYQLGQSAANQFQFDRSTTSRSPSISSTFGSVSPTSSNNSLIEKVIDEVVGESMLRTPRVYRRADPDEKESYKYIKNRERNNEAVRRTREKNKVRKMLEEEKYEQLRKRYNAMIDALKKCKCGCATQFIMENCDKI